MGDRVILRASHAATIGSLILCHGYVPMSSQAATHAPETKPAPPEAKPGPGYNNVFFRICPRSDVVLVFVHGIFSDSLGCWTRRLGDRDVYWPALICEDARLNGLSIFLAGYYSRLDAGSFAVPQAADEIWTALKESGSARRVIDYKTVVFICHSQGGIVVREMLSRPDVPRDLAGVDRIGILLLGSPSVGSLYALLGWPLAILARNVQARQLTYGNLRLADLADRFLQLMNSRPNWIFGVEGYEHWGPLPFLPPVVSRLSGAGHFDSHPMPATDHFTVAKPAALTDPQHRLLITFLQGRNFNLAHEPAPVGEVTFPENSRSPGSPLPEPRRRSRLLYAAVALLLAFVSLFNVSPTEILYRLRGWPSDLLYHFGLRKSVATFLHVKQSTADSYSTSFRDSADAARWAVSGGDWGFRQVDPDADPDFRPLVMKGPGWAMLSEPDPTGSTLYDFSARFQFRMAEGSNQFDWYFRLWPYDAFLRNQPPAWTKGYLFRFMRGPAPKQALSLDEYYCEGRGGSDMWRCEKLNRDSRLFPADVCQDGLASRFQINAFASGGDFAYSVTTIRTNTPQEGTDPCSANHEAHKVFPASLRLSPYGNIAFGGSGSAEDAQLDLFSRGPLMELPVWAER